MCFSGEENLERVGEGKPVPFACDAKGSDWYFRNHFFMLALMFKSTLQKKEEKFSL